MDLNNIKVICPLPKLFSNHSLATTVFHGDLADSNGHESESVSHCVCLLLERSCLTEMLTPKMARMSQAYLPPFENKYQCP